MRTLSFARTCILLTVLTSAAATAGPEQTGALGVAANRIVGLWLTEALVGPCNAVPGFPIRNTLLFQAGGTVVENPRFPPSGIPDGNSIYQRGQALGTWTFDPATKRYAMHLRFDNYVSGIYDGYSTVDREIELSNDGMFAAGAVTSSRYTANGGLVSQVCGQALSIRE